MTAFLYEEAPSSISISKVHSVKNREFCTIAATRLYEQLEISSLGQVRELRYQFLASHDEHYMLNDAPRSDFAERLE